METCQNPIEKTANYEGDHTLLFLERLNNPENKKKLVDSLAREWAFWDPTSSIEVIRKQEEEKLNNRIEIVFNSTKVDLDEKFNPGDGWLGDTGTICPLAQLPLSGKKFSTKQLNITEAHEKGHGIRSFTDTSPIGKWIISGFDFSKITFSKEELTLIRSFYERNGKRPELESDENLIKFYRGGIEEEPNELVERMSQLKNYFGMKGNEEFTKENLDYARKNYTLGQDPAWIIQIKPFFDAITKDTEKNFLNVINNLGV